MKRPGKTNPAKFSSSNKKVQTGPFLRQIYRRVFYLWKCIDLDSAWVTDCRPYQLSFFS